MAEYHLFAMSDAPADMPPGDRSPLVPGAIRGCRAMHLWCGIIALGIGLTNLLVWLGPLRPLSAIPGAMFIRLNTAVGITLAAIALLLWLGLPRSGVRRTVAITLSGLTAALGGLTALQDIAGVELGIDRLFGPTTFVGDRANAFVVHPGRMSLNASLSLFFISLALVGMRWRISFNGSRRFHLAPGLALTAALPAVCGVVGYLVGVSGFTGLLRSTNILLHTALALLCLSLGVLVAQTEWQPVRQILSRGADGVLLRWLLPGTAILLVSLGWLIARGRRFGLVQPGEGAALMLYGGLVLLFILIIAAARAVQRQELAALHAAEALREGEQRFRALADNISQLAWMTDEKGQIVWVNQRWSDYTGTTLEQFEKTGWAGIQHDEYRDEVLERMRRCFSTGSSWEDVFPMKGADGAYRWFLTRAMPIRDQAGVVYRWFGTHTDITEQRQLAEELANAKELAERASQAKDSFIATLSHELRTPLTPVLLSAAALQADSRLPSDVREELVAMERNIALEGKLIDDLLDLTRITRGMLLLRKETCDVHSLIIHAISIVRSDAESKGVALNIDLLANASGLVGDPARLQQIFWNVLKNAVKFTKPNGHITVSSRDTTPTGSLIIEIRDDGIGFAPESASRLFEPFEQERTTPEHRFGGLGLGLSISRTIAELHGGAIEASSPGVGRGATFTITLPGAFEAQRPHVADAGVAADVLPSPIPLRILLVDDHEATLKVLSRLLVREGYQVMTGQNVACGMAAMDGSSFDVLISDLGLPDGSGCELMEHMRRLDEHAIGIAVSGYGMETDFQRSRAAGFTAHLVKPVDFSELMRTLRMIGAGKAHVPAAESIV